MGIPDIGKQTCSVAHAVGLVGDPWTLMILRELFLGSRRFDELQTYTGISPHLLSLRLRNLAAAGILERRAYQERPRRYEYRFTAKGLDLWPIVNALREWGDRWARWPKGPPLKVRHRQCGKIAALKAVCSACGEPVRPRDVELEMSPAALAERAALAAQA